MNLSLIKTERKNAYFLSHVPLSDLRFKENPKVKASRNAGLVRKQPFSEASFLSSITGPLTQHGILGTIHLVMKMETVYMKRNTVGIKSLCVYS